MEQTALGQLTSDMAQCCLCDGLPLGPRPLFQLHPQARILIAGQAPGRVTHAKGRPFDDVSGDRLRRWLGVTRETFYDDPRVGIFPMGLCYPGTGKGGDLPPRPECAATWRAPVLDALPNVALTLIMGRYAIDWHLPHLRRASVTNAVRTQFDADDASYVLPHPSPRNMRWLAKNAWFEADCIPVIRYRVAALLAL